ncbi:hypothetical protein G9C98_000293 [Cotesia typhae]|uniref:Uncharacterized protein n=1 Tax=Cotesia typhae TaxID=2053667 RepID=A0A8J5R4Y9_9HYME|nr:hypothetical protein G9C98_000293 [Cotesia typhae]
MNKIQNGARKLSAIIEFDGNVVGDSDMTLCEAFDDETIGRDLLAKGLPDGIFPKNCPVKASNDLEINKYVIEKEKVPDSVPDGPFKIDVSIYMPDQDPIVKILVEGDISRDP